MKISKVHIHNIRTVKDAAFDLKDYSLLIGANNAGKTNIIDAIRIFYEKIKFSESNDICWFKEDEEVWIEIEYILTDEEYNDLKEDYRLPDNKLKIRKYLKTAEIGDDGKPKCGFYAYDSEGNICGSLFYGVKNVASGKLGNIIYIPAQSTLEDQAKMSGASPLRDLITGVFEKVVAGNAAYDTLKANITEFSDAIKEAQTEDEKSLAKLQQDISNSLDGWDTTFEINFKPLDVAGIIKNMVSYKIGEAIDDMSPYQMGSGFQRHLIFSLIDIAARYPTQQRVRRDRDFTPNMSFLLFEEPEAFLHPDQQLSMCRNLKKLGAKESNQVLVSSHSPHFVSQNTDDISSIIKLNKVNKITEVGQISKTDWNAILAENVILPDGYADDRDEEDKLTDIEAIKYFLWLDPERCGCFFSKYVLLVEGASEKGLFNHMIDKEHIVPPSGGVFILDCMGKENIARFMRLLEKLKIPHSVIFDDDNNSPRQKPWNDHIKLTRNAFTKNIKSFSGDLETFLGVPKPRLAHRKPQRLMYNWLSGAVAADKQEALKAILNEAIAM